MQHRENKIHIGFFGRCNVGKSTLINTLVGQDISIVSEYSGTTTDTVKKTIELTDIGQVVLIDTAGIDDKSVLGEERKKKTLDIFSQVDFAVLVISENRFDIYEENIIDECKRYSTPYIVVYNKEDLFPIQENLKTEVSLIVSKEDKSTREKLHQILRQEIRKLSLEQQKPLLNDIIDQGDVVVLVTPIDASAPKGRLILPQVKTIREIIDQHAIAITVQETELGQAINLLGKEKIKLVITDSQIFKKVDSIVPKEIPLTSFSIILAKEKGNFNQYLSGTLRIDSLQDGDNILILESCTHTPTCEDIGRVKLPNMLKKYTGKNLNFTFSAGLSNSFNDIEKYQLVIQCGGCMATKKQMQNRLLPFIEKNMAITNYGMTISYVNGIFKRAVAIFQK
ncbi:MAG: [FeFe] hydrogenase H-cluster maturation GTPase HydF [Bacteroidales bacterium]|nr:[FeFe] hydrogenase H-cluster maturation GTPase HydF [Bacteroidales bacterium]MEE3412332.1 [FeFe] hydrogenase H-cluster maturation GTPase HydF [Bacteroidales bacterium]